MATSLLAVKREATQQLEQADLTCSARQQAQQDCICSAAFLYCNISIDHWWINLQMAATQRLLTTTLLGKESLIALSRRASPPTMHPGFVGFSAVLSRPRTPPSSPSRPHPWKRMFSALRPSWHMLRLHLSPSAETFCTCAALACAARIYPFAALPPHATHHPE